MSLKYSVADGGFIQASVDSYEFRVKGEIESPTLVSISAPLYVSSSFSISEAILAINQGAVGTFRVQVKSTDLSGLDEVTHLDDSLTLTFNGAQGWGLDISIASISANRILTLYAQRVSGGYSSDISLTLK